MIRQMLVLIWNRKRINALIMLEITLSFLVLFAVVVSGLYAWKKYSTPLGFDYRDTLSVVLIGQWEPHHAGQLKRAAEAMRTMPEVSWCEASHMDLFTKSYWTTVLRHNDKPTQLMVNRASDQYHQLARIPVIDGRWFGPQDTGGDYEPLVLNRRAAQKVFGSESPLGKVLPHSLGKFNYKVVGIIEDYRQHGDLDPLGEYGFRRYVWEENSDTRMRQLMVRLKPGTPRSIERDMLKILKTNLPDYDFSISELSVARESYMRKSLIPLITSAMLAVCLLLMVAMGLLGVLWQNVAQRTQEIGLRRAIGASTTGVLVQISGELLTMTAFSVAIGTFLALQVPFTGLFGNIEADLMVGGITGATSVMLVLAFVCSVYPAWLAMRITPADALHYE